MSRDRWVTADTHFSHETTRSFYHRPFRGVKQMDEALVDLWNETVSEGDEVYHLGDLYGFRGRGWEDAGALVGRLNGKIHFVRGNHDPRLSEFSEHGWKAFESMAEWRVVGEAESP